MGNKFSLLHYINALSLYSHHTTTHEDSLRVNDRDHVRPERLCNF